MIDVCMLVESSSSLSVFVCSCLSSLLVYWRWTFASPYLPQHDTLVQS
jgi:hypothetical protein